MGTLEPPDFLSLQVARADRFYLPVTPGRPGDLEVVCGGWEECTHDYRIDRDDFPYFSIEYVEAGGGELVLNGRPQSLEPGVVFSYGPAIGHLIRAKGEAPLRKYFVDFRGRQAPVLLREIGLPAGSAVQLATVAEVKGAFDTLLRLATARHRGVAEMTAAQLRLLALAIKYAREPVSVVDRRALATFERCRRVIDAQFRTLRSVDAVATRCHVDVSYLSRLFQRFHGTTPLRYLRTLQMQWAAQRLHTSGNLVREVADELGIDPYQFSRTFKRIHGVSPVAFLATRAPALDLGPAQGKSI